MLEIQRAVFYSQIGAKSANGLAGKIPPIRPMIWPKLRVRAKSAIRVRMLSGAKKKRYKATYSFKFDGVVDLTTLGPCHSLWNIRPLHEFVEAITHTDPTIEYEVGEGQESLAHDPLNPSL